MKIDELYEVPLTITENGDTLEVAVEESVLKRAGTFMAKHPIATGVVGMWAASALKKYKKNKRYTTRFFAKTTEERKLYDRIVKDLMATGNYRLIHTKFVEGGKLWELVRSGV